MTRLRRLSNFEIENVVADLTGANLKITSGFLEDPRGQGYDNDAASLSVSASKLEEIDIVADRVATFVTDPARLEGFAPCADRAGAAASVCARGFIASFARRAWGRPPDAAELDRLAQVFVAGGGERGDYAGGIALTVEALLLSPHFNYVTELGAPGTAAVDGAEVALTGAEIASALSFMLTGSRPDPALLTAGLAGELGAAEARRQAATRLVTSPPGRRHIARFIRLWLYLDDVAVINKDLGVFPIFVRPVRDALDRELTLFLEHVLASEDGKLEPLFWADYSFPGPALRPIYNDDLLDPIGDFTRVRLKPERRRGLLSSPAFLARHALINQTNPVERGLIVRNRLFCQDVPAPPPFVAAVPPGGGQDTTTRSKYERHVSSDFCRGCHRLMDPLGFGLEEFDALGRYRTFEFANAIDARGEVTATDVDGPFVGPVQLSDRLRQSAMFRRCVAQQIYRFALGRAVAAEGALDKPEIDYLAYRFDALAGSIPQLFVEIAARRNFGLRAVGSSKEMP